MGNAATRWPIVRRLPGPFPPGQVPGFQRLRETAKHQQREFGRAHHGTELLAQYTMRRTKARIFPNERQPTSDKLSSERPYGQVISTKPLMGDNRASLDCRRTNSETPSLLPQYQADNVRFVRRRPQ